jgi:hypothetical protein
MRLPGIARSLRSVTTWFDLRAIALALVLSVAVTLPYLTTSESNRNFYFFDVTLTSSSPGYTQVFWDIGYGFREDDSSRQPLKIEPRPVVYRYMMPMGRIKAMRLDPLDGEGDFTLAQARIVDAWGRIVHEFAPADFKVANDIASAQVIGDTAYFVTKPGARDAVLELHLPAPVHLPGTLRIWAIIGWPIALPFLVLGLVAGLPVVANFLARAAVAIGERAARRPGLTLLLATLLGVAVQCYPVIFLGRSLATPSNGTLMLYGNTPTLPGGAPEIANTMGSDVGALLFNHLYYPMVERDALQQGELPLWNRYSLGGMPLLGQGQSMFGEPLNFIPILADGAAWAWDLRFLLARWLFVAALTFTAWRLTRHLLASVLVALTSAFIGYFTFKINHPANFSVSYAPLILLAWTGFVQAPGLRPQAGWLALLMLANGMVMTSGTVKEAYMAVLSLNLAGVILLALLPEAAGRRMRLLGLATAAGVLFTLLMAPVWISFLVALKHSWTVYDSPGATVRPLAHVIGFFDDIFYRQTNLNEMVLAPALNFLFLPGVLWWLTSRRLWRTDRAGLALALGSLLPFCMAFGVIPPALIAKIPFVGNIHHVDNTFSCSLMVLAILLAGCGFADALRRVAEPGWWRRTGVMAAITAGLLAAYFVSVSGRHLFSPFFRGYVPSLVVALVLLPCALRWSVRSGRPGALVVALVLAAPLLLWRHGQYARSEFNYYAFAPGERFDLHAPSPAVEFVNARTTEPGRRVGLGHSLYPTYNITLDWEGIYGVDTLRNGYYHELALEFDMRRVWVWDWTNEAVDLPRLLPVHDLLNVDYYVADHRTPAEEFPGLQLVRQLDMDVYVSPTAWPRAFFTDRLAAYETVQDFARQVATGDRQPFASAQRGQTDLPAALSADLAGRTVRAATDYRLTANTTTFTVDAPGPGIAVLTEAYYPYDFQVTVNGQPAPYFRVNHAFKGVYLASAGRHEITYTFWPLYTTLSLWLAAAGALLTASAAVVVFRQTRLQRTIEN